MAGSGKLFAQEKIVWKKSFKKDFDRILFCDDELLKAINSRESITTGDIKCNKLSPLQLQEALKQIDDPSSSTHLYSYDKNRVTTEIEEAGFSADEIEVMKPSDKIKINAAIFFALENYMSGNPETGAMGAIMETYIPLFSLGERYYKDKKEFQEELIKEVYPSIRKYLKIGEEVKIQEEKKPFIKIGDREGDKHGGTPQRDASLGGTYAVTVTDEFGTEEQKAALLKQENNKAKNLTEYAVSRLSRAFDEKYAYLFAQVFLVKPREISKVKQEEQSPYVGSVYVADKDYTMDLWKYIYKLYLTDPRFTEKRRRNGHQSLSMPTERPKRLGSGEPKVVFDTVLPVLFEEYPVLKTQFAHIIAMSYWSGDPDKHFGNIMIRFLPDQKIIEGLSSIDFASGFDWFDWEQKLLPMRDGVMKNGFQPTNHIKEYSRNFRITQAVADAFEQYANVSDEIIRTEVGALVKDLTDLCPENDRVALAETLKTTKDQISERLTNQFITKRNKFKNLALEIRLSCYFVPKHPNKSEEGFVCEGENFLHLKALLEKHPDINYDKFTFRSKGQEYYTDELKSLLKKQFDDPPKDSRLLTDSPMPFIPRLKYALLDIYNLNPNSSAYGRLRKVIGWPEAGWPNSSWPQPIRYIVKTLGFIIKLPYSILKIGIELLPAIGEQFFDWASDRCLRVVKNPQAPELQALGVGVIVCFTKLLSWVCLLTRLVTMRITSPKKSIEQAMRAGKSLCELLRIPPRFGTVVGYGFAFVSAAVTLVGWSVIAIAVSPLVATLSAKIEGAGYVGSKIIYGLQWAANNPVTQTISATILKAAPGLHCLAESITLVTACFGLLGLNKLRKYFYSRNENISHLSDSAKKEQEIIISDESSQSSKGSTKEIIKNGITYQPTTEYVEPSRPFGITEVENPYECWRSADLSVLRPQRY
jgi:hypothetical protein